MKEQQKLINLIDEKKLKCYFVLSLARTRSTALQLSLAQASEVSGQINLPFNSGKFSRPQTDEYLYNDFRDKISNTSVEEVSKRINNVVEPLIKKDGYANFIIHEHFDFLAKEYLSFLCKLSTNFIYCIRDPRIQFLSYILRAFNKFFLENDSRDNCESFTSDDLLVLFSLYKSKPEIFSNKMMKIVARKNIKLYQGDNWYRYSNYEKLSKNITVNDLFSIFLSFVVKELEVAWINAESTIEYLFSYNDKEQINMVLVDGENFVKQPSKTLKHITSNIVGLSFSDKMVNGWDKSTSDNFVCYMMEYNKNTWNGPSRNSKGITFVNDGTNGHILEPALLPENLANVLKKSIVIYQRLSSYKFVI